MIGFRVVQQAPASQILNSSTSPPLPGELAAMKRRHRDRSPRADRWQPKRQRFRDYPPIRPEDDRYPYNGDGSPRAASFRPRSMSPARGSDSRRQSSPRLMRLPLRSRSPEPSHHAYRSSNTQVKDSSGHVDSGDRPAPLTSPIKHDLRPNKRGHPNATFNHDTHQELLDTTSHSKFLNALDASRDQKGFLSARNVDWASMWFMDPYSAFPGWYDALMRDTGYLTSEFAKRWRYFLEDSARHYRNTGLPLFPPDRLPLPKAAERYLLLIGTPVAPVGRDLRELKSGEDLP